MITNDNSYYKIYDNKTLQEVFDRVILNNDDYKKAERLAKIPFVYDKNEQCGQKIYKILFNDLR